MKTFINSTAGRLEAIYKPSENANSPCVLILHPHPLYDGNMHNKVVYMMDQVFYENGFSTLRFNFRGVGDSEGEYDEGKGEIIDASTCCDWLQGKNPDNTGFWVAGFSFGAYIALQIMMRRIEITKFVSVGLPANMFDVSFVHPCPTDGLFIHGEKDTIAPLKEADKIIKKAARTKNTKIEHKFIKSADHFFTNHQKEFQTALGNYIKQELKK